MELRPLTARRRALTRRWAPRIGALAVLLAANLAYPLGRPPSLVDFVFALVAALIAASAVVAVLYARNLRLVFSPDSVAVVDIFGLRRVIPRAQIGELVGVRLSVAGDHPLPHLPLALFRGSRGIQLALAGPLWNADALQAAAERLGVPIANEALDVELGPHLWRRLSISG